ncbi:MAG: TolC family protein [Cyclobacteriaceae bacterium]|jgi:outer membrane protein TolC|nr:TolC family protein [Cyclobacteriaceae bacterium]
MKMLRLIIVLISIQFGNHFLVSGQTVLDTYIDEGLKNNLVLEQRNISLEKAMYSLKIANGLFSPSLKLIGDFISGDGGRSISFPVGDLLNPVYATLNQLTGSDQFPQIENVTTNFFPREFYDVRARTSMPIFNTDLIYNRKISQQQVLLQDYEVAIYKRELIRNIKMAYFNYMSAREGVAIYESALTRAMEGKRVNESLLANGKGLQAYVLRSQSEIESIKAQLTDAERQLENSQLYFNFLLNRDPSETILTDYSPEADLSRAVLLIGETPDTQQREELFQLKTLQSLNENIVSKNKYFWAPRLSGFLDIGAQSENLIYTSQANFYLYGFSLEMPLFNGFTNRNRIAQSRLEVKNSELSYQLVQRQLHMSSQVSKNTLISAYQNYQSALKQLEAAESYQRLIERGYKEGVNTFIEAIDARNQLTSAQLSVNLNQYRVLIAEASLERETASYTLR